MGHGNTTISMKVATTVRESGHKQDTRTSSKL